MTEAGSITDTDVQRQIAGILKQRRLGLVVFAVTAGVAVVLAAILVNSNKQRLAPIVFIPLIGIGLAALARVFHTKCPACGKLFFSVPVRTLYASTCYYCKAWTKGTQQQRAGLTPCPAARSSLWLHGAADAHVRLAGQYLLVDKRHTQS